MEDAPPKRKSALVVLFSFLMTSARTRRALAKVGNLAKVKKASWSFVRFGTNGNGSLQGQTPACAAERDLIGAQAEAQAADLS